jgi:chromosomal replication initiation ATPase DnaA
MYYAAAQQITTARHIARSAQRQIKEKTGMRVSMMLYSPELGSKTPEEMLHIIAVSLGMNPDSYRMKTKVRHIVELRFVAAILLRRNFPTMTLHQIATLFGGQDHSSIISGLARANDLIYTGDPRFLKKYNTALKAVDLWLKKEE